MADIAEGLLINQSIGPPLRPWTILRFWSGSNQTYEAYTRGDLPRTTDTRTIASTALTNIVVSSNTATATTVADHGLVPGNKVTVSGATVDLQLNDSYIVLTIPTSKTFTFTTASVADGTYVDATMQYATDAPLTTRAIWAIMRLTYNSNLVTQIQWAEGTTAAIHICDNRALLEYR